VAARHPAGVLQRHGWSADSTQRGQISTLQYGKRIDLSGPAAPQLSFWQRAYLSAGDLVAVEISLDGGSSWLTLDQQIGLVTDWAQRTLDLSPYQGQIVGLRFRLDTTGLLPNGAMTLGYWIDDLTVETAPALYTPVPTQPATQEPTLTPPPTVRPAQIIESDSLTVQQTGQWIAHDTSAASGGRYLYSSGVPDDALSLVFEGTRVDVVYIQHPALGSFDIEIDGVVLQTVSSVAADSVFGARSIVSGLAAGPHTLRVVAVTGTIAIDAFAVEPP